MRKLFLMLLVLPLASMAQKTYTVSGYIKEAGTQESLIGANVVDLRSKNGVSANQFGFYSITLPADSVTLSVSFIGYETRYFDLFLASNLELDIFMNAASTLLNEVELVEEITIERQVEMSSISVPVKEVKKVPALFGEVDVMKVIQLLPGVQSGSEGTSGIYVRGGGPDQNLILLDGVPVYNASHLFGFFSVFNSDAVKNVQLTKGGFPARFGGRLSSVVEIDMKDGRKDQWGGSGTIGLISSRLMLEGPVKKGKSSLLIAGRRTYIDALIQPFLYAATGDLGGYYFGDLNVKYHHILNSKDNIHLSLYTGDDSFYASINENEPGAYKSKSKFGFGWGNLTSALRWNRAHNNRLFSNLTATYSQYKYDISFESSSEDLQSGDKESFGAVYQSFIRDLGLKYDLQYNLNNTHKFKAGASVVRHQFEPGAFAIREQSADVNLDSIIRPNEQINSWDAFAYLEDEIRLSERAKLNLGLHGTYYQVENSSFFSLQPRLSGRYMITDKLSAKLSYAKMQQYLHLLSNSGIGLPTDLWVSVTDEVDPMNSHQVAAGLASLVGDNRFEFSAEVYYKTMDGLIAYENGASFLNFTDWQEKVVTGGTGESYGLELFLQKKKGNTSGWIGYTLSWTNRQFPGTDINNGNPYPYRYDRRHDVSVVITHQFNDRIDAGLTWVYGTGNAITLESGRYVSFYGSYYGGEEVEIYKSRNGYRMEDYHRLDLSVNFTKEKKRGKRVWNISLYNAYARNNPFFYMWSYDFFASNSFNRDRKLYKVSVSPIIPGFSWTRTF